MANTSTTTLKSCTVRPQSSISRLVDQLKQSSLNEHQSSNFVPLLGGCADRFHRMQSEQNQQSQSELENPLAFESGSTSKSKAVPITKRKGHSREEHSRAVHFTDVFTASSSACSSDSNRAGSEPEDECDSTPWQPDSSAESDACCYQLFSTSAPTPHSVPSSRPLAQIESAKCKGFCCCHNHPYLQCGQPNSGCPNLATSLEPGDSNLPSSPNLYPYHSQAKRACRSLSASSAVKHLINSTQPSTQIPMAKGVTAISTLSYATDHKGCHSMQSTIKELETRMNSLPRPIAIRPDSKNHDQPLYLSSVDSPRGYINGVPLRPKPTEPVCGSRLSWHHPVFTTGSGCRAHPPNYVSHCNIMQSETGINAKGQYQCTHNQQITRRSVMIPYGRHSGNWCSVGQSKFSIHDANHSLVSSSCTEADSASGSILIHPIQSPSSAFTPTRNSLIQFEMGIHSSGCSLSPDADSAFSSVQIPARTPSSGFHEASFSGLSETSSLPDCTKFCTNHPLDQHAVSHPTNKDKQCAAKISGDIFFAEGLDFQKCDLAPKLHSSSVPENPPVSSSCVTSSSTACSSSSSAMSTTISAIRCQSQPSATSECPSTASNDTPVQCESSTCTVGLKRRRGPSGENNNNNVSVDMNNNNVSNNEDGKFNPTPVLQFAPSDSTDHISSISNPPVCFSLDFNGISPRSHSYSHGCPHVHYLQAPNTISGHLQNHHYHQSQHQPQPPCTRRTLPSSSSAPNRTLLTSSSRSPNSRHYHQHGSSSMMLSYGQLNCTADTPKDIFIFGSNLVSSLPDRSMNNHHHRDQCTCPVCPDLVSNCDSFNLLSQSCGPKDLESGDLTSGIEEDHSHHNQPLNPDSKHLRPNFDFDNYSSSYRHMCNELTELSEAMEEEKDYETPETITEDTGSHSTQTVVTSPSIQEVTFAPIRQCSEIWEENNSITTTEEMAITNRKHHPYRPHCRSLGTDKNSLGTEPLDGSADLFVTLSSPSNSDSDSSDSESILSPQMPNRQLQCSKSQIVDGSADSAELEQQRVTFTDLDLDLIENN